MPTRRTLAALCSAAVLSSLLAACSTGDRSEADSSTSASVTSEPASPPTSAASSPTESAEATPTSAETSTPPERPALSITIKGDAVRPNAQELEVDAGKSILIAIESDRAGQLHVHSKPGQYVKFEAGSTTKRLTVETPGSVEIEEHETSAVVAILEVR